MASERESTTIKLLGVEVKSGSKNKIRIVHPTPGKRGKMESHEFKSLDEVYAYLKRNAGKVTVSEEALGVVAAVAQSMRNSSCERKQKYPTNESADRACVAMYRKKLERFESYSCDLCRKWHIGHALGGAA